MWNLVLLFPKLLLSSVSDLFAYCSKAFNRKTVAGADRRRDRVLVLHTMHIELVQLQDQVA